MTKRHTTRRRVSAGAALVTGLGTIGLGLFTAAPAQAAPSAHDLAYTCTANGQDFDADVNVSFDLPESVEPGEEISAPQIAARVELDEEATSELRDLGISRFNGSGTLDYDFGGQERMVDLSVPASDVSAEQQTTVVEGTGTGQAETAPSDEGEVTVTAGDITASLTATRSDDSEESIDFTCTPSGDATVGTITVAEDGSGEGPETNDWFIEPESLPVKDNTFEVEGTAEQAGTLIIQVLDGDHEELTSYTWDVEAGEVSNSFELVEGADYVRILSQDCVDEQGNTEETPDSGCNVEYKAPWADSDTGDGDGGGEAGDGQDQDQDQDGSDSGDAEETDDSGDAGQPQIPDVVQTDGGQLKGADSTNTALALGGLLLFGAGAGAVFAARRRSAQS